MMMRLAERIVELHQERHHDTNSTQNAFLNAVLAQHIENASFREPALVMEIAHYLDEHPGRRNRRALRNRTHIAGDYGTWANQ